MMAAVATLLCACNGNNPTGPSGSSGSGSSATEVHDRTASMYVGITGFNNKLYHFTGNPDKRYDILNKNSLSNYTRFVNSLNMANNTALFWAVEDNVNHLKNCQFPEDIENLSIVTFTDGLENGSGDFDDRFIDIADYEKNLEYLKNLISKTSVQGVKLTAYSIGIQGSDVTNVNRFTNTLENLSSGKGYSNKVDNMTQVNETFKKIANDLYKQNSKPQLTVAVPPQVRKERIVFDQKSATESKIYIEATKLKESPLKYSNITYVGCKSDSGSEVQGEKNGEGSTVFVFDNFTDLNGGKLSYTRTDLWYWDGTEWAHDAEYDGQNGARTEEVHKSAAIMLILDCSKSLEEQNRFADVKNAAVKFLETLAGAATSGNNGGDNGGDKGGDNGDDKGGDNSGDKGGDNGGDYQPHCWEITYSYQGYSQTAYVWATEAEVIAESRAMENEPEFSNYSYKRASANDESSCYALNEGEKPENTYYIKHPWGTGEDKDWAWQEMTYVSESKYVCYGWYGGVGANIGITPNDNLAWWIPESDIVMFDGKPDVGDYVCFEYNPETDVLGVRRQ